MQKKSIENILKHFNRTCILLVITNILFAITTLNFYSAFPPTSFFGMLPNWLGALILLSSIISLVLTVYEYKKFSRLLEENN